MAAPTRILTLSLGTQTIGLAEFKAGQNAGVVLSSYDTRELLADPAADSTRIAQANLLLKEMVQSMKLRGARLELRGFLAIGLHPLRQAAFRGRGAGGPNRDLRGAAECALSHQ